LVFHTVKYFASITNLALIELPLDSYALGQGRTQGGGGLGGFESPPRNVCLTRKNVTKIDINKFFMRF
jgi:hypothetical protein